MKAKLLSLAVLLWIGAGERGECKYIHSSGNILQFACIVVWYAHYR